jgi:photosystem II stability/assembly factor-like uncharacterized protein
MRLILRTARNRYVPACLLTLLATSIGLPVSRPLAAQPSEWQAWEQSPGLGAPPNFRLNDIFFSSPSTGWLVSRERVFKTSNGGESWEEQEVPGLLFRSVAFSNDSVGWVGTLNPDHVLYETRDGGSTWEDISSRIAPGPPPGICGFSVVDSTHIFAVGRYFNGAYMIATKDAGKSWRRFDLSRYARTLVDVIFFDRNNGLIVGGTDPNLSGHAVVLGTTDGGESWAELFRSSRQGEWAWKVFFPSRRVGYVAVESYDRGLVLKTENGGKSWKELAVEGNRGLQGIGFISEKVGWVGGWVGTSLTIDGGETWIAVPSWMANGQNPGINRFRLRSDSVVVAAGRRAFYLRLSRDGSGGGRIPR